MAEMSQICQERSLDLALWEGDTSSGGTSSDEILVQEMRMDGPA